MPLCAGPRQNFLTRVFLLAGHSLGGALAIGTAATQPGVLQAVAFAPTAFHRILTHDLGLSEHDIKRLPRRDLLALGDPYDCLINSVYVPLARDGATTCLFEDFDPPAVCSARMLSSEMDLMPTMLCKGATHNWRRYAAALLPGRKLDGRPRHSVHCGVEPEGLRLHLQRWLASHRPQ